MAQTLSEGLIIPSPGDPIPANGNQPTITLGTSGNTALATKASTAYVAGEIAALSPKMYTRGTPPAGTNFDTWVDDTQNGLWTFSAGAAAGYTGLPPGYTDKPGSLVHTGARSRVTSQTYYPYGYYSQQPLTRSITNISTNTWSPWRAVGDTAGVDPNPRHSILQAQMINAIGPVITGGKGAVAFRIDHGFANLRDKILPLLKARGIKPAVAYNPRNWHYPENAGVTASDLNGWVAAGDVDIMNHSANHLPADTEEALYDQIVNGLAEIEAQLPAAAGKVWGFAPPGVSSGDYQGFNDGRTASGWDTYAGRLILANHAVGTGYLAGTSRRVLDGQIHDGLGHVTIDGQTVASVKASIDEVIASKRGLQLMMHPSQVDTSGKLSTAQVTEILDYIVAKRTSGDLAVLSPYEMLMART